ncbi:hypothetical protein AYI70_g7628 [Smittium culicis]|uniref:Uncharacterized protein n=1 Tax=Smittium culicis TaxID=133412 RepID=A0A1R1XJQ6_9FUNG|nr:hypothetical protein AYI70_g7628 [Smittium culicis]
MHAAFTQHTACAYNFISRASSSVPTSYSAPTSPNVPNTHSATTSHKIPNTHSAPFSPKVHNSHYVTTPYAPKPPYDPTSSSVSKPPNPLSLPPPLTPQPPLPSASTPSSPPNTLSLLASLPLPLSNRLIPSPPLYLPPINSSKSPSTQPPQSKLLTVLYAPLPSADVNSHSFFLPTVLVFLFFTTITISHYLLFHLHFPYLPCCSQFTHSPSFLNFFVVSTSKSVAVFS